MLAPVKLPGLFLMPWLLFAAGFWDTKPFPEWSDKELQKLMTDSPWVRQIRGKINAQPSDEPGQAQIPDLSGPTSAAAPSLPVMLRWISALPVKQGEMRARFGKDAATAPEARKFLEQPRTFYILAVAGIPGYLISKGGADNAKEAIARSTILTLKGKPSMQPTVVEFAPAGLNVTVMLGFPRSNEITLADEEVAFSTVIGTVLVRYKFKLKDMVVRGKLEL